MICHILECAVYFHGNSNTSTSTSTFQYDSYETTTTVYSAIGIFSTITFPTVDDIVFRITDQGIRREPLLHGKCQCLFSVGSTFSYLNIATDVANEIHGSFRNVFQ